MTPEEIRQHWPTFCPAPYKYLDIRRAGQSHDLLKTCCCNLTPVDDPEFVKLKQDQQQGVWNPACNKCFVEEAQGGLSERIRMINDLGADQCQKIEQTQVADNFHIKITFSNLCNLACRSCVPSESSTFSKYTNSQKYAQFQIQDITTDYLSDIKNEILTATDKYHRIAIHINGGESMLQQGAEQVLDWMIEQNLHHKTPLILTTAATVTPNRQWQEYFKQYHNVWLNLSIDSVGNNYHYVRWPSNFNKVNDNIQQLFAFAQRNPRTVCQITPVISLNNIFYLDKYLDYWLNIFSKFQMSCIINPISLVKRTWHLDIDALPQQYRPVVTEFLDKVKQHPIFTKHATSMIPLMDWIDNTLQELQDRYDPTLWDMFLKHTAYFDLSTGAEFANYNEKFYNILSDQDKQQYHTLLQTINLENSLYDYVTPPL